MAAEEPCNARRGRPGGGGPASVGLGMGSVIAGLISWELTHSLGWTILHVFGGWIYVLYSWWLGRIAW